MFRYVRMLKMVGLSELSWEDPQEIQNQLRLKLRREQQVEQDQQIRNSSKITPKNTKKRQSSLVEFMG